MSTTYDLITVGGGLAGSVIGGAMAERGARVLILERDTHFKDRVRGEGLTPWGVEDARQLGIYELLRTTCGAELPNVAATFGRFSFPVRDMTATTPQHAPMLSFFHPQMQETLLEWAIGKGAEVRRGVTVTAVRGGSAPTVTIVGHDGPPEHLGARLIAGADGRRSMVRHWGGFTVNRDPERNIICGIQMENMNVPGDAFQWLVSTDLAKVVVIVPRGNYARAYLAYPSSTPYRLQTEREIPHFLKESTTIAPAEFYAGAKPVGPLVSYSGADSWVTYPYREGVALIGDAAASNDPSYGQGMSLTLRDVRVLRDRLAASDDWDNAASSYARSHDLYYDAIHSVTKWFTELLLTPGPQAAARCDRALAMIAEDPSRLPDHIISGPEMPIGDDVRRRFFGEDQVSTQAGI